MKLVSAKCPSCGANLKVNKNDETIKCEYCQQNIIIDDAIACYKLKISGIVSIDGISTNSDLIKSGNELISIGEYLQAKKKFREFSEKCPKDYQGWLGLLICRTRNFTIRDNNIMFQNDVDNYLMHFKNTASKEVYDEYFEKIDRYLYPDKYKRLEEQKKEEERKEKERKEKERKQKEKEEKEKQRKEEKERKQKEKERLKSEVKNKTTNISANSFFVILLKIWNITLYILGGLIILAYLLDSESTIKTTITMVLFGMSLFKITYVKIGALLNIDKKYLKIIRVIVPIVLFIIAMIVTPS